MDTGAVADTLMSALTRVQTALAPPPDTAGDAEYAAQVEDDLHWLEQWQSTCDAALAASLAPPIWGTFTQHLLPTRHGPVC